MPFQVILKSRGNTNWNIPDDLTDITNSLVLIFFLNKEKPN